MAVRPEDVRGTKMARAEFSRRGVDLSTADIRCMHGNVYVRGTVSRMATANYPDLKAECELIAKVLRTKAEIRDVVLEVMYRG